MVKYLLPVIHSSLISIRMDPTWRRRDSSFGNTPTTTVLRFNSLLTRSIIFVVRIRFPCCFENAMQLMIPRKSLSKVLPAFRYPLGIQVIGEVLESLLIPIP